MTYREIGEIYSLSPDATYNRIRRFKKKVVSAYYDENAKEWS